jgi:hypothetical protein
MKRLAQPADTQNEHIREAVLKPRILECLKVCETNCVVADALSVNLISR